MKGILLAGGHGRRMSPLTDVMSKHLLPVYDKPLIYHPLTTLLLCGVRDILIIALPRDLPLFRALLLDGSQWGCRFSYAEQAEPRGVPDAFLIASEFIRDQTTVLALGDNIFYGDQIGVVFSNMAKANRGATILAYRVKDPRAFGVVEFDASGRAASLEEKPANPRSDWAVPGLYVYDETVVDRTLALRPSARGEIEINDLNLSYMAEGRLAVHRLGRGFAWLDAGSPENLLEASEFVHSLEKRQGLAIACPEEVAFRMGFIDHDQLLALAARHLGPAYSAYLRSVANQPSHLP